MQLSLLEILRCPFCGSTLSLEEGESLDRCGDEIAHGIIYCQCSAYPVVAGIPVFTADYLADNARGQIAKGEFEPALWGMLGLDSEPRQEAFREFERKGTEVSYRDGVEILCPDAEGTYFVYRFSDPTFLVGSALIRAIGNDTRCWKKRALDLCGGSGHLTRVLCELSGGREVVLADAYFWKLWLAKRFTAPECQPVCCDANNPLPFAQGEFSLAVCSDAFHYIWSKRLLASEMMRIAGEQGVIVLSHIHNSLAENYSAGMPLAPKWWRNLFAEMNPRLFRESEIFESAVTQQPVDLSKDYANEELSDEPALSLIATRLDGLFRSYNQTRAQAMLSRITVNPLYRIERNGEWATLRLDFPTTEYEDEFGQCKRYLADQAEIRVEALSNWTALPEDQLRSLLERRVLLDLPKGYL